MRSRCACEASPRSPSLRDVGPLRGLARETRSGNIPRGSLRARWATCALAILIAVPAFAGKRVSKSLSDCTSFTQTEKGDDAFELAVHNSCKAQVDCSISWKVVCAPKSQKRRAVHAKAMKFTLTEGTGQTTEASAAVCGDEAWTIEGVVWGCEPSKD